MNTELHYVDSLKNVTASCEGWRKPLFVLWTCNPVSHREAPVFKPQSLRRAVSTKALPASRSVYIVLLQSWETLFILHGRRTVPPSPLRRDLVGVLKDPCPAHVELSSASSQQRGRSCFGPKVHVLKAALCRSKSFWLAVTVLWLLGLLPTSLPGDTQWWGRQQRGWRVLACNG